MLRICLGIKVSFCLLVALLIAGIGILSVEAHNMDKKACLRPDTIEFNVGTSRRTVEGNWAGNVNPGECLSISKLKKGVLRQYGENRWWGVNARETHKAGHRIKGYRDLGILHPITSRAGWILNVDSDKNGKLTKLFQEHGIKVPPLPKNAVKVTARLDVYYLGCQNKNGFFRQCMAGNLFVRKSDHKIIDKIYDTQSFWVTDVVLDKFPIWIHGNARVWAKVYSLYTEGNVWVPLRDLFGHSTIKPEGWDALEKAYPWLAKFKSEP